MKLYNMLADIYINNGNKVNRNTAVMGMLYNKGVINDRLSIKESNNTMELRRKFRSEDKEERKRILERFEKGELTDQQSRTLANLSGQATAAEAG